MLGGRERVLGGREGVRRERERVLHACVRVCTRTHAHTITAKSYLREVMEESQIAEIVFTSRSMARNIRSSCCDLFFLYRGKRMIHIYIV